MPRRFEFKEGTSKKFWEVEQRGASVIVRYGRLGTDGRLLAKKHADPGAAAKEA
jgi:predicted DNA-binding WGR domain protein